LLVLLRRSRGFTIFLVTQGVSNLGDAVRNVVVPLYLLQLTHSPALVAGLALLEVVPVLALQLPAGVLIDRWDRRRTLALVDVARGLLTLLIPATALLHGPVVAVLFATTVPLGALQCLFAAGFGAVTPALVDRERVERAYALTEGVESLAWVAGPAVAGVLATTIGGANALAVDGASFLLSALGLVAIRVPPVERAAGRRHLWRELVDGVRFLAATPVLRRVVSAWVLYLGAGSGVVLGLVTVGSRGGRDGVALAAIGVAAYAAGSLLGTTAAGWRRPVSSRVAIAACLATVAAGALLVAVGVAATIVVGAVLFGLGEGFFLVIYLSVRAEHTPDELMGRITSACRLLGVVTEGAGVAWMGLALQWVGGPGAFGLLAALAVVLMGAVAVTAARSNEGASS
jgi:MFS family permease